MLSVRSSVTLRCRCHIGWVTFTVYTRNLRLSEPQDRPSSPTGTSPKYHVEYGWSGCFSRKPAISPKRLNTAPLHQGAIDRRCEVTHSLSIRLIPKSTTLDDLKRPSCTLFQNTDVLRISDIWSQPRKSEYEDRPILSAACLHRN